MKNSSLTSSCQSDMLIWNLESGLLIKISRNNEEIQFSSGGNDSQISFEGHL